ncbi:MAG: FAD-dependent oxidoreductase [Thermoplasmata archaeon]
MKDVLIIGGGTAGIGAAETLLSLGKSVAIVDTAPFVGGVALELSCKGDVECTRCHVCMPRDAAFRMRSSEGIEAYTLSEIGSATLGTKNISLEVRRSPRFIDTKKCIACGKCIAVCPVKGALVAPPHGAIPNVPYLNPELCRHFQSGECDLCAKECPTNAFDFQEKEERSLLLARAVIVATGMDPIDPSGIPHYGYGYYPNVLSSLDAERMIASHGELRRPSDGQRPGKIAIIQCVGSRTTKGGVEYCSKFCCKYAIRIARSIIERFPETAVDFLYMDLRTFEPRSEALEWAAGKKNVGISQGVAGMVQESEKGKLKVRRTVPGDASIEEGEYDMVILSVGARPRPESKVIAAKLALPVDSFGFISRDDRKKGVFVAGSCKSPMDIEESFADGKATAFAVLERLGAVK